MNARLFLSLFALLFLASVANARPVSRGYFEGNEFVPVGEASLTVFTKEPAVVILFALDSVSAEETRKFNNWYLSEARGDITAYGIALRRNMSELMFDEALSQRELKFPVFAAERDLLLGDSFRVLYLDNDKLITSLETADLDKINAAISGAAVQPVPPAATPSPVPSDTPLAATTPLARPEPTPIAELLGLDVIATETVVTTEATTSPLTNTGIYINDKFAMTVLFPPGTEYIESTTGDGAVAKLPDPTIKLDFRVWAENGNSNLSAEEYIREHIKKLEENWNTEVKVERRFRVTDDEARGSDCTYNYLRPISPAVPEAGRERIRGRIQVFSENQVIKAAAVEGLSGPFTGNLKLVEGFMESFAPRVEAPAPRQAVTSVGAGKAFDY